MKVAHYGLSEDDDRAGSSVKTQYMEGQETCQH